MGKLNRRRERIGLAVSGVAESEEAEEVESKAREFDTHGATVAKYIVISVCPTFCCFISLKTFLFYTVSISFFHSLL